MKKKTNKDTKETKATRDAFGEALLELAEDMPEIVVLSADLNKSTRVQDFAKKFPERFIQVGVAEQNLASIGVGLALAGKIPVITSFGVFSPGKNWDQIRIGACYNNANLKIVSTHTGLTVGKDGATHQALEDIALMRVLPNMSVFSPVDFEQTKKVVKVALKMEGPVYIRLARAPTPVVTTSEDKFEVGKFYTMEEGQKISLIATGPILTEGLTAAQEINSKYPKSVKVLNAPTIKPLDTKDLKTKLKGIPKIVTLEEHQKAAGFGSAVCETLARENKQITVMGVDDSFGESGSYENLKKKYNLDKASIKKVLLKELKE